MTRLSIMDQLFYKTELGGLPTMYMAGAMIVDPSTSPYPLDAETLAGHLAARMEKIPILRQKLIQDTLKMGSLRLVDDPEFDVNNHVTCSTLPSPGGYRELTHYLGALSQRRLDLSKPLWRFEIIDGLEGGNIGIAMQLHHSIFDGTGAAKTLNSIWSAVPEPAEKPRTGRWKAKGLPSNLGLLRDALLEGVSRSYIQRPRTAVKLLKPLVQTLQKKKATTEDKTGEVNESVKLEVHKTSLNTDTLSDRHSLSYAEFPLREIKALNRFLVAPSMTW